jgi:hypothetical protein
VKVDMVMAVKRERVSIEKDCLVSFFFKVSEELVKFQASCVLCGEPNARRKYI